MKCSDECLLFLALRRGSKRLCWQSSVFALKGYPRTEPRQSTANFHPIALAATPDLPVTWEVLIWRKTIPVIVGNNISTLLLQPQHLSCSARSWPWSCWFSVDQINLLGWAAFWSEWRNCWGRLASSCGSDRTSVLAPGSSELPRVRKSFPSLSDKKGRGLGTMPACHAEQLCSSTSGGTKQRTWK